MPKKKSSTVEYVTKQEFEEAMFLIHSAFERVATKDDLKNFVTKDDAKNFATKDDIKELRQEFNQLDKKFDRGFEAILNVVQSIDAQLKEHRGLPDRVAILEDEVTTHAMEIRHLKSR